MQRLFTSYQLAKEEVRGKIFLSKKSVHFKRRGLKKCFRCVFRAGANSWSRNQEGCGAKLRERVRAGEIQSNFITIGRNSRLSEGSI